MKQKVVFLSIMASLIVLTGCAALSTRDSDEAKIRISDTIVGGNLELSPPLLKVRPGQEVVWSNDTTFNLQVQFEAEKKDSISGRPTFISPLSDARAKFETAGEYSYTLVFSSTKTFGRVTGKIVVEDPNRQNAPGENSPEPSSPEESPAEPFTI